MAGIYKLKISNLRLNNLMVAFLFSLNFYLAKAEDFNLSSIHRQMCEDGHVKVTSANGFSWADYLVLACMLVVSCGIGIFFGFFGAKHTNSQDFLLGSSSMGAVPMGMSLAASLVTAIELLGNPAEMYTHGSQFWMICVPFLLVSPITYKFYLPVFMNLSLTSSYEYLSMRFSPMIRYLASGLYIFQMVLYTSVAVYAPALALSRVTGLNVYIAVIAVYAVCIFYSSQGGMKAVIIADTYHLVILLSSIILVMYLGAQFIGNQGDIWGPNYNTDRLEIFNFDTSPTVRHTFWSVVVGGTFYWTSMFCSNQASIQKYLSVGNINHVKTGLWLACAGLIAIYTTNFYTGMILVTHYKDCDPITSKEIDGSDEILPLYITSVMGHLRGLTGYFVAGISAASLGTVAAALNSLAAVTIQDFIESAFKVNLPDRKGALVVKILSVVYGVCSFGLVFIVAQLGSIMQVAISFNGVAGGITLGLFSLGMFFPWANAKGAITGSLVAVTLVSVMCFGQQIYIANGILKEPSKPTSVDKCPCFDKADIEKEAESDPVDAFFRISYIWYSAIGFLVTFILGAVVSLITGPTDPKDVDEELISPPIKALLSHLPNSVKDKFKIPYQLNSNTNRKDHPVIKEVFTITLDQFDQDKKKVSTPS